jgi:hypothetical protein
VSDWTKETPTPGECEPKPVNGGDIACWADVSPEAWAAAYGKKMAEIRSWAANMSPKPLHRQGGCLVLSWGPPWNWKPSFQRSRHHSGWSISWLWWGLATAPVSFSTLMLEGAYPRCPDKTCRQHINTKKAKADSIHVDCDWPERFKP